MHSALHAHYACANKACAVDTQHEDASYPFMVHGLNYQADCVQSSKTLLLECADMAWHHVYSLKTGKSSSAE